MLQRKGNHTFERLLFQILYGGLIIFLSSLQFQQMQCKLSVKKLPQRVSRLHMMVPKNLTTESGVTIQTYLFIYRVMQNDMKS